MDIIVSADDAASRVLRKAMEASDQGTFAVGGILFRNDTGEVVKELHNNVFVQLKNHMPLIKDPTAHGERQLVSWYYDNKKNLNLPEPEKMTLVTSLDPCVMCTGSLLIAGFNVAIIAVDDFAGINYDSKFDFHILPELLRSLAKKKFGYYACGIPNNDPKKYVRKYFGSKSLPFINDTVSAKNLMGCNMIFVNSVRYVESVSNLSSDTDIDKIEDPFNLPDDSAIKEKFRKIYDKAFTIKTNNPRFPDSIVDELRLVASNPEGNGNAVAFIDPFGNLVLCQSGAEKISPVRTAFMDVVQNYSKIHWSLINNDTTRDIAEKSLIHPRYGTFLFLYAPDPNAATTIMDLGAHSFMMYRSISENHPSNLQYVNPPRNGTVSDLISLISNLPPFYTAQVGLSVSQISFDQE
ncbi:MAG: nucleoside deaminase [Nitrosopumilus sp.]|nr:nucleoside deaminase [Nitrosopumilus sp.]